MKKTSLLLILMVMLSSTTLVASAQINPYHYLMSQEDGCYHISINGNYNIDPACIPAYYANLIPPTMNIVADGTVSKEGTIVTVKSFTSNPTVPYTLPAQIDIANLNFPEGIDVWVLNNKIGFTADLIIGTQTIPVTGTVTFEGVAGGVYNFAFDTLYINQQPITGISGSMQVTVEKVNCEQEIPEFPTVAIPMAAIIGLAFFMQRRKD
ncbi:PEF-CTERM sorting domain-containing protein [Methanolobus profundi]|uniref:PEF-CTERM protein sorting domain-containing protein n=1 Tax=Methanolobus profundi TaxID=487685 RepID=A0A1I4UHL3_9EURY|nr:PEF-CTERM sorting domain-containing protein [Methanolobus profundi]SFM88405.1 PEF-CTERM protein sorting domain-containing protein [Methanolobus profundi]